MSVLRHCYSDLALSMRVTCASVFSCKTVSRTNITLACSRMSGIQASRSNNFQIEGKRGLLRDNRGSVFSQMPVFEARAANNEYNSLIGSDSPSCQQAPNCYNV